LPAIAIPLKQHELQIVSHPLRSPAGMVGRLHFSRTFFEIEEHKTKRTTHKETQMSNNHIIRAWKDSNYRNSLSEAERAALPPNPAGFIELTDAELNGVAGGAINPPINPKPHTCGQLCVCPAPTSVEKGCTVTQTYTCAIGPILLY
jgi:mersacidin/lichenicidin family type 2 lantibiotic